VSEQFYHFLKQNKDKLKKSSNLSKYYLRAGKILRPGESIPKPKYKYLISRYKKKNKNVLFFNTLIKYIPGDKSEVNTQGVEIRCNMDLNLYNYSLYLSKEPLGDSANFAFYHQNSLALGVATQGTDTLKGLWNTNLIQGTGIKFQAKFCKIKSNDSKIVLVSSKGKDPGQHLFHFLKNKVQYSSSLENIDDFIISPRHLYLVNPFRVVYESGRGSKQKLGTFLNSGIPIYHSSSLGRVWAWGKFKGQRSLIKDPRDSPYINCPKQQ